MATEVVRQPYPHFTDASGEELENGYIYIGTAGADPEASPITVYWDQALSVPAVQPLRTVNGLVSRGGKPTRAWVGVDYSIKVKDGRGVTVATSLSNNNQLSIGSITVDAASITYTSASGDAGKNLEAKIQSIPFNVVEKGAVCDGVTDDIAAIQASVNYCIANGRDLEIPGMCLITSSINIDRIVDGAANDHYFTISSSGGGGIVVKSDIAMFSTTLVNPGDANHPVTQLVKFKNLKFEADVNTRIAYVLDENKYLRTSFESCNFRKIKCLSAGANKFIQSISFHNCQARRWTGTFLSSKEATFDLKVMGGLWEAGGDGFDIDFPVGTAFMGANIEGMSVFAIKYIGGYGLCINGNYFEQNGFDDAGGCSIDGSLATGSDASESVLISGNYFSGESASPTKPQVKWGDGTSGISMGNLCTTTLHDFATNSRVSTFGDYARTELTSDDSSSPYSGILNEMHIGTIMRASGNFRYGGMVYGHFESGNGGYARIRSFSNGVQSAVGLDVDHNGDVLTTGQLRQMPSDNVDPSENGEVVVEKTSNTTLTFKLKGSDGTVRSGTITLA